LYKIFTLILVSFGLLINQPSIAAPIKNTDLQVAFLELSKQKAKLKKHSTRAAKKKKVVIRYSSNCINWSAVQINRESKRFDKIISKNSKKYRVDSNLIKAVITAESCFKTKALSHKGAQGLMQLIPATARRFGVTNSYKPEQSIRAGIRYLKFLIDRFKGNLKKVIAAYNAGEGKVDKYKGIPPFRETRKYVKRVIANYHQFKGYSKKPNPKKKPLLASKQKKAYSGLQAQKITANKRKQLPSGLAFNKPQKKRVIATYDKSKQRANNKPVISGKRIRTYSTSLARKPAFRKGYTRIFARKNHSGRSADAS